MSQEASHSEFPSGAGDVALGVEQLIKETNEDLKNFRVEQSDLRSLISAVLNENRQLTGELGKYKKVVFSSSKEKLQERLHITNNALSNAIAQIEALKKEKHCLHTLQECSQRTIKNMETELESYRAQLSPGGIDEMAQTYTKTIKMLETRLSGQQEELRTQAKLIKVLHEHKQRCGEQIDQLQCQLKDRLHHVDIREDNQTKVTSLQKKLREFEKSLLQTRTLLEESKKREVEAMRKVQDAITISEAAVHEKDEAEKRAESYKEEARNLAFNIGSIMDEAANRVDNEVTQLKTKLAEKDKIIASIREKHKSAIDILESRSNRLSLKYKEALKQNEMLEMQVQSCNKRLIELEQCTFHDETHNLQSKKDYESQMENYLHSYKELKSHYKELLQDLTNKFKAVIENLQREKCELQADNDMFKSGAVGDGIGKLSS
ncbi:golgin subfamily A member 6-like protein 4 isoform X2 [Drosophila hydei]|uniref:Golgin subfamily A member 6-like protein 4 isoform X2 n=1 Tax=Drosophila hydei TaxID=7224 RepID=A0A6J1LUS9_DROHY|nr:golgin subfamily A member 6-like protein 4 isoform X2 [Drosophila hydei]